MKTWPFLAVGKHQCDALNPVSGNRKVFQAERDRLPAHAGSTGVGPSLISGWLAFRIPHPGPEPPSRSSGS